MKAIVCTEFGTPEVLQLKDVEKPAHKENEILVKIHATSVNYGDLVARRFNQVSPREFNMPFLFWLPAKIFFGLRNPKIKILGSEFAGEVEDIGQNVTRFKAGDQVFGYLGQNMGAYAEYLCMPENGMVALKPGNMTYEEAATVPMGAIMALSLLRKASIQAGHSVLINGASGGIGSHAVQLAKHQFGAEVTGVCATPRLEFVKSIGADQVVDYTQENFSQNGQTYDLIFDILGRKQFSQVKQSLKPNGKLFYASFKMRHLLEMFWTLLAGNKKVICAMASENVEDLDSIREYAEAGKIKSMIDKRFPMEQAAEAHRYVEAGHKKGHVVITMEHGT